MTKVLIIGANSFVGHNFIKNSRSEIIDEADIRNVSPEDVNFEGYDVVLHLAAIVHQSSKIEEAEYFRVNRDICIDVAKCAKQHGIKQFVFISTVKVYGEYQPDKGIWDEHAKCEPDDPYGQSKYAAELELRRLEDENFTITIIRPPLIYGKGVKANMLSITKMVSNFSILPLGGINNKRSFTAVENLVALIDLVIEKKASGIFIAMDARPLSTTELVRLIAKALGKKIYLFKLPNSLVYIGNKIMPRIFDRLFGSFEIDNPVTRRDLGYKPIISSEEGIKRMIESYKSNQ